MEAEQRIVIGADSLRQPPAGNGLIEHAANPRPVDVFASNAKPNESAGAHVDHHEEPMTTKENRLAAKQVDAPEAVLGVRKEGQPGGARGTRESGRQVLREHAAYDIQIDPTSLKVGRADWNG